MTRHTLHAAGLALREALRTANDLPGLRRRLLDLVDPARLAVHQRPCRDERLVEHLRGLCRAVTHTRPGGPADATTALEVTRLGLVHGRWQGPERALTFFYFPDLDLGLAADPFTRDHWRFQIQRRGSVC